jgi:hypothetical protein
MFADIGESSISKIGIGMVVAAVVVAVPVALNLPQSWLGGVIVFALAGNGIVLLVSAAKRTPRGVDRITK